MWFALVPRLCELSTHLIRSINYGPVALVVWNGASQGVTSMWFGNNQPDRKIQKPHPNIACTFQTLQAQWIRVNLAAWEDISSRLLPGFPCYCLCNKADDWDIVCNVPHLCILSP